MAAFLFSSSEIYNLSRGNEMPAPQGNQFALGNEGGRPTKYKSEYAEQAYKLCLLGATDKELADFFEVEESTINNWKNEHEEFLESLKRGKGLADANVADRLYQRAIGFEHDSEELKVIDGKVVHEPIRKIYPPDTVAAIFWLKNRQKDKWRDKNITELEGKIGITLIEESGDDRDEPITD